MKNKRAIFLTLSLLLFSNFIINAQSVMSAGPETHGRTLKSKLYDSSIMQGYNFENPFQFAYYNSQMDKFYYDNVKNELFFTLINVPNGKLNIIIPTLNPKNIYVKKGDSGATVKLKRVLVSIPHNDWITTLSNVISIEHPEDCETHGYEMQVNNSDRNLLFTVELGKNLPETSLLSIIVSNNNKSFEVLTQMMFKSFLTLYRILGESNIQGSYFASFQIFNDIRKSKLFYMVESKHSEKENLNQVVSNQLGNDYRLADWNDIKNNFQEFKKYLFF